MGSIETVPEKMSTGVLEMEKLPKILEEYGVDYDEERLPDIFNIYDLDRWELCP